MPKGQFVPNRASQALFVAQLKLVMAYRVNKACKEVQKTAQRNISGTGSGILYGSHRASAPGDFPALETGTLHGSVKRALALTSDEVIGLVGTDEKRGLYLEYGTRKMAPRPWLRKTLASLQTRVNAILRGKG